MSPEEIRDRNRVEGERREKRRDTGWCGTGVEARIVESGVPPGDVRGARNALDENGIWPLRLAAATRPPG